MSGREVCQWHKTYWSCKTGVREEFKVEIGLLQGDGLADEVRWPFSDPFLLTIKKHVRHFGQLEFVAQLFTLSQD